MNICFAHLFVLVFLCVTAAAAQTREIRINLVDPAGAAVTDASVRGASGKAEPKPCANDDHAFICMVANSGGVRFEIAAKGFKPLKVEYAEKDVTCCEYVFVLQIEAVRENVVTITRSDSVIENTPESVAVLDRQAIATAAAPNLDDVLRQVPGFSIFRRSSSRNANPTTQGVSLRGVGATGASRSVVLFDGVGWIQWNRISPIALDEVEVLRGGASNLYGGSAVSGGVELRPRSAGDNLVFSGEVFSGSQRTVSASAVAGTSWKGWSADISGGHFQTRGFIPVDEDERGPVDSYAGVRSVNLSPRIGKKFGTFASIFFVRPTSENRDPTAHPHRSIAHILASSYSVAELNRPLPQTILTSPSTGALAVSISSTAQTRAGFLTDLASPNKTKRLPMSDSLRSDL